MADKQSITAEFVRKIIDYNPENGSLMWKPRTPDMFKDGGHGREINCKGWNTRFANKQAGAKDPIEGYLIIGIYGTLYRAHRIAWLYMTEEWPENDIDHKNLDRIDNTWSNLRQANDKFNNANKSVTKNNKLGVKGVNYRRGKYEARIRVDGRLIILGYRNTKEEAAELYAEAAIMHFGEFARVS